MELFVVTAPGLEALLAEEMREHGFSVSDTVPGGVKADGDWNEALRANLMLRGAVRVLARLGTFRAMHLAQLDKRARRIDWGALFSEGQSVRVDATCRASKIYHNRAAAERVARAITETTGAHIAKDAELTIKVRIEDDLCVLSFDTTGAPLHRRGIKEQVNKAPMRENLAALFLRACGFDGSEPVFDPMCGSGTFPIEAAEMALALVPGRARRFSMDQTQTVVERPDLPEPRSTDIRVFGSDRDQGAVNMSRANADRAGVAAHATFTHGSVSDIVPPTTAPGLLIANPPYGGRVGNKRPLFGLYAAFGAAAKERFSGWRVGIITSEAGLAKATGLPWREPGPIVDHGGIKVRLWQTGILP